MSATHQLRCTNCGARIASEAARSDFRCPDCNGLYEVIYPWSQGWSAEKTAGAEVRPWQETDPLDVLGRLVAPSVRAEIDREIALEIAGAVAFAQTSPFPAVEELLAHVYAP